MRLCHKFALAIVLVILLALLIPISLAHADAVVDFPDPNLEAAIRQAIHKPSGDILQSDLVGLYELQADNRNIINLTGLEHCTSLWGLYLHNNQISDISPLSGLTNLVRLYRGDNQVSDINSLVNNSGLARDDLVDIRDNPLSATSINTYIPQLQARGVEVVSDYDFSPWLYDADYSGSVERAEAVAALMDYFSLAITKSQAIQVLVLYFNAGG